MDRNLRAFLAVAQLGNLTAAADHIGLTQPALTKTIRRLETSLAAKLFERSVKGMILTDVGHLFLDRARTIEMNWTQAREEIRACQDGALNEFNIAAGPAYNGWITPQLLNQLALEFPDTRLALIADIAGSLMPMLQAGEIHLLLGAFIHEIPDGIVTEKLIDVENGIFCWNQHPLAQLTTVSPEALSNYRWVIYKRDVLMRERLAAYFLQFQMPMPRVMMEIDTLESTRRVLKGSDFLTVSPTVAGSSAAEFDLIQLKLQVPLWSFPSGVWMRRSTTRYPILRRSVEILKELVRISPDHSGKLSHFPN